LSHNTANTRPALTPMLRERLGIKAHVEQWGHAQRLDVAAE
jgi:hypothetical protein